MIFMFYFYFEMTNYTDTDSKMIGSIDWVSIGRFENYRLHSLHQHRYWTRSYTNLINSWLNNEMEIWRIQSIGAFLISRITRIRWNKLWRTINQRIAVKKAIKIQKVFRGQAVRNRYPAVWKFY